MKPVSARYEIRVRELGDGPTLLMIHGWGMSSSAWRFQEPLAAYFRMLMPDLPGHGTNLPTQDPPDFSMELIADMIAEKLSSRSSSSFLLVGWSLGSMLALQLASRLQSASAGLILVGATACFCSAPGYHAGLPEKEVRGLSLRLRRNYGETLGDFFKRMFVSGELDPDQYQRIVREVILGNRQPSPALAQAALTALATTDIRTLLPAIQTPTLVIHGMDDTICPPASARYLADHLPNAVLQLLPGTGHAPFLSRPEEFNSLVVEFGREVGLL